MSIEIRHLRTAIVTAGTQSFSRAATGLQHRFYELAAKSIRHDNAAPVSHNDMIDVCEVIEVAKISAAKRMTINLSGYRDKVLADISHA